MPEVTAVPSAAMGRPSLRTALRDRSTAARERQSRARSPDPRCARVYEGSTVVRRAAWRGMLKDRVRHTCEHLAMAEDGCLTCIPCVKSEYPPRINEILYVE